MEILSGLLCFIGIFINLFVVVFCYSKVINLKLIYNIKFFLVLFVSSICVFLISLFLPYHFKIISMLVLIFAIFKILFDNNLRLSFVGAVYFYTLLLICDFLMSFLIMSIANITSMPEHILSLVQVPSTLILSLFYYLLFKINFIIIYSRKIINIVVDKFSNIMFFVILYLTFCLIILTYIHSINGTLSSFVVVFILISFFIFLFIVSGKFYHKNKTTLEEQKNLLKIMGEYELILEKDRINRHEMLNNLLVLKTYKDKSSKQYEELISDIVDEYSSKKTKTYRSLYKLPKGIKGIVYYKMSDITEKGINFESEISKFVYKYFDEMDSKLYYKICKIVGILLDNAIEACMLTERKLVILEIYNDDNNITILIQNSTKIPVNLNDINRKGFSTKGINRGLGLYLVDRIVKSCDNLILDQYMLNEDFITELKIVL